MISNLVGDYQNFIRNCQKSSDFDQSDQRFWNSGAPKDLTPQMNVNNVCAPIPHQLLADFTSMSQKSQPKRNRRHRTVFTDKQLRLLEAAFNKTLYPDVILRQKLAETMNLKEEHVHVSIIAIVNIHYIVCQSVINVLCMLFRYGLKTDVQSSTKVNQKEQHRELEKYNRII